MEPIKQVTLEKTYDAAPETVWEAWTKPEMLKQWWGPNDVLIPECEVDLRVGGTFYIVMEAGEGMGPYKGTKWPMRAEFTTVEPQAKLAYSGKAWVGAEENEATTIEQATDITFTAENGKTKVKVVAAIYKSGPNAQAAIQGMQAGFTQQLEKLNAFLAPKK